MHIDKFKEDAKTGGWSKSWLDGSDADILLDKSAWVAVGETRGWNDSEQSRYPVWFFAAVMEGDDYETALSKLV